MENVCSDINILFEKILPKSIDFKLHSMSLLGAAFSY